MSNPCRLYPHCQIGLSAVVGCRARWLQNSGDVVLDILHCVLYDPFWPGGFLLACSSLCLVGIHFGGSVDLDEAEVCEDWWPRYLAGTAGVCVESECLHCKFGCCNPFRGNICEGVQNLGNMHRRCLESEAAFLSCLSAMENISGSFAAPRKTVKALKQRLWPNAGVAGRLAARGFFAARLCVHRTQHDSEWHSMAVEPWW